MWVVENVLAIISNVKKLNYGERIVILMSWLVFLSLGSTNFNHVP